MSNTEHKIIAMFARELQSAEPMQAAHRVCIAVRVEVTAMAGEESGANAFLVAAGVLAKMFSTVISEREAVA